MLQAQISGGDIGVQVRADNPQFAFHAMRDLIKQAASFATRKWLLAGSGRTGNSKRQTLPRNLMGFQDGTANIVVEDTAALDKFVWAGAPASAQISENRLGSPIWRPLPADALAEFESLVGPLSDDPAALGPVLLIITKALVDGINPAPLKASSGPTRRANSR